MGATIRRTALGRAALALAAAALVAGAFVPARVPDETRTGWLHVVWQTRGVRNELVAARLFLVDERGRGTEVSASAAELEPYGGLLGVNGRRMTVTGDLLPATAGRAAPVLRLRALAAVQGPRFAVTYADRRGPQAYVLLLCRFADLPDADPQPKATYAQWMGNSYPGLDHYWRESSEDRVSISAPVEGPFVLPLPAAAYMKNGQANLDLLLQDCTRAADPTVDFSRYGGIHMQFNSALDNYSWGGGWTYTLDGQTRRWGMTWMASWASPSVYAHETGHSLGLPHSSGPYGQTYDSHWDVMSGGASKDPELGTWVAPHTIAFHKDLLGWIPAARKYVAAAGTSAAIDLARGALPGADGYQMAQVPIAGTSAFYTVEARRYAGYDAVGRLPAEGVLIHRVNLASTIPAKVVDPDGNGNPNDAGATWVPGETFTDVQGGVQVRVLSQTGTGYRVEVSTGAALPVALDPVLAPATMGAAYDAALAPELAGASWTLVGGALPRGLALSADGRLAGVPAQAGSFRFTVSVVQAGGFVTRELQLDVAKPQLAEGAVLDQLLGAGALTADEARFLDLQGNANGRLDVGDVRAWMIAQGILP
ncbi:MAG TPA: putative Ig domain-containing protein [Longimicrobium sp.]|nr:putative Ig domain-containing protein [Longimicrobium sp.]